MPILEIKALPQKPDIDVTACLKAICCAVADAVSIPRNHIWGTWESIKPGHYVEGDKSADVQMRSTHPPLVNVIAFEGRSQEDIETMIFATAKAVAQALAIAPENVFLTYTEVKSGKVFTGGKIRSL